jgi:hypothetical protein
MILTHETQLQNEVFLQSRKDDPSIKERERALQTLDLSYHKYREIVRNLEEGIQVRFHPVAMAISLIMDSSSITTLLEYLPSSKNHAKNGAFNGSRRFCRLLSYRSMPN